MEYITIQEAKDAIAPGYSNPAGIAGYDVAQSHLVMNCWVSVINELAPQLTSEFRFYLVHTPLKVAIDNSKKTLDLLRSGEAGSGLDFFSGLVNELSADGRLCTIALGFPTRFTLGEDMSNESATIADFRDTNRQVRDYESVTLPVWFEDKLMEIGRSILKSWKSVYAHTEWKLPTGATYECTRSASAAEKLLAANRLGFTWDGYFPGNPKSSYDNCCTVRYPKYQHWGIEYVPFRINPMRLVAVPKNYKSMRTIGMEETYRQLHLGRIGDAIADIYDGAVNLRKWSPVGRVCLHDQTRNQDLARKGSINDSLATIDFSHASDSISSKIASLVLPPDMYEEICTYRANRFEYGKRLSYLNIFSPMGSRVTFPLETHIFWVLAMAARDYGKRWFGITTKLDDFAVYGDDVVLPSSIAELFIDFATMAGFTPNLEKSYVHGSFRESCGEEYHNGIATRGLYWPRRVVEVGSVDAAPILVSLQQRLCGDFPATARMLGDLLLSHYPNLTYGPIGSDGLTIWSAFPILQEKIVPVSGTSYVDGQPCVSRRVRKISRLHSYIKPKSGLTAEVVQAGEALAYLAELKGERLYADSLCEMLHISEPSDHRRFTGSILSSIRSRYEEV